MGETAPEHERISNQDTLLLKSKESLLEGAQMKASKDIFSVDYIVVKLKRNSGTTCLCLPIFNCFVDIMLDVSNPFCIHAHHSASSLRLFCTGFHAILPAEVQAKVVTVDVLLKHDNRSVVETM